MGTLVLVFGTQFPDLVDKPLALLGVLPRGRLVAHSIIVASLLVALAFRCSARFQYRPEDAVAFGVGYGSHLVGDSVEALLAGEFHRLLFLAWPLVPAPDTPMEYSIARFVNDVTFEPTVTVELLFVLAFVGIWLLDGCPGTRLFRRFVSQIIRRITA